MVSGLILRGLLDPFDGDHFHGTLPRFQSQAELLFECGLIFVRLPLELQVSSKTVRPKTFES